MPEFTAIPNAIIDQNDLSSSAFKLYCVLAYHRGRTWPSYRRIQQISGIAPATISKAYKELEAAGWIASKQIEGSKIYFLKPEEGTM